MARALAASSTSTAQIVVRGWRSGSGPRSLVNAIVRLSGCHAMSATPQSPLVTWRGPPLGHVDDEQVRPAIEVALLVVPPVGPGDAPRDGTVVLGRLAATGDRRRLADDEPGRVDLGREGEPVAVRRPGDLADRPMSPDLRRPDPAGPAEVEQVDGRDRVVVGGVGADEGDRVAVGAEPRLGVADRALGELARPGGRALGRKVDREQVADVPVALDRPPDDDRGRAVGRQVELLDHDDAAEVLWGHRSTGRHQRQGSGDATLPACPNRRSPSPTDSSSRPRWPRRWPRAGRSSRSSRR